MMRFNGSNGKVCKMICHTLELYNSAVCSSFIFLVVLFWLIHVGLGVIAPVVVCIVSKTECKINFNPFNPKLIMCKFSQPFKKKMIE